MQQTASHNRQKKLAVINDFCGFGRCSIAVALPIISAMHIMSRRKYGIGARSLTIESSIPCRAGSCVA